MVTQEMKKQSISESIFLHILPGACIALFTFLFSFLFREYHVPALFFLQISVIVVMIPVMYFVLRYYTGKEHVSSVSELIMHGNKVKWYEFIGYVLLIFLFAALVLSLSGKTVHQGVKESLFFWLPGWMDVSDIYVSSHNYSSAWIITVWVLGIFTTGILGPVAEEVYFRGFLLPRIKGNAVSMVLWGSVLFSVYHLFSPWMIPGRVIALMPLIYIVLRKRNIMIGITAHCLLNLAGDTLSTISFTFF